MSAFGTQIDIQRMLGKLKTHTQMKSMVKLPVVILGLLLLLTGSAQKALAQDEDISLQSFYDELSPYGTWIQDPQYGYVWRPDADQEEFRPYYTNGRWVMTEYGNTWVSNYEWGWAPFHYGRWVYNRYNQWVWIPDTVWGPAWVSWRSGGGYYGWAPLGPGMQVNISFNIPSLWWVFVPQRNIYYDRFPRYYSRRNVVIINNTTIINNTYVRNRNTYYTGPRADEIRRYTGRDVNVYSVDRTTRPGRSGINGSRVEIYSPRPARGSSSVAAAPRTSVRGEGYTTARQDRSTSNGRIGRSELNPNPRATTDRSLEAANAEAAGRAARAEQAARAARAESAARTQADRSSRIERSGSQPARIERQEQPRIQPQAQQERRQTPQRQERSVQPSRPQPQRIEQSRGSENRGSQNEGRTSSSRSSRGGRG